MSLIYPGSSVLISNYAHAIGQISSRGTRDRIFVSLFCLPATWRTIFGGRAVKHARHVASSRNFKRVTLSARASLARSVLRPSSWRNRARYVPSQTVRYVAVRNCARAFRTRARALKQQSSLVFRAAGMLYWSVDVGNDIVTIPVENILRNYFFILLLNLKLICRRADWNPVLREF